MTEKNTSPKAKTIAMMSRADMTKGHGVLSVYEELIRLLNDYCSDKYIIRKNSLAKADIYHYHTINTEFYLTLPIAKKNGVTVGFVHFLPQTIDESLHLWKIAKSPFYWYMMKFYDAMDHIVVVNPHFIDQLVSSGIDRDKITYIPNCVSAESFFRKSDEEKKALRKKYNIPEGKKTVIGVGQLQIRKGVEDFVEVAKRNPDKLFMWIGGFSFGKMSDGYENIKKMVDEPPENVRFTGIVDREEMNDYYNAADMLFLPSFAELFPVTILEALSCHLPIVVRDLEEYHGIVSDYCVLCRDNEEFDAQIKKLCEDEAYYREMSAKSAFGSEYYSAENVAKMWEEFYDGLDKQPGKKKHSSGKGVKSS